MGSRLHVAGFTTLASALHAQVQQELKAYVGSVGCRALLGARQLSSLHRCRHAASVHRF